ncbi:MBL fold metallo-hydrolase [Anaeromyxobacter sp. SG26]|uniref:MBL fold metallo-hydrolase n=1 Tax=Anaeromyxobacter sp. SG26 TaxID=2925407 RepID=UPI001F5A76E0|nr:MBL fold metallo-hydrolase [Anaeromyxobacter sp. SG26]
MTASPAAVATAVVLFRDGPAGREVFLVRRGVERRFAAGFHAFPGGRLDPEDAELEVPGHAGEGAALVACAARELFEETGVLLARRAGEAPSRAELAEGRRAVLDGTLPFRAFLERHRLALDPARLAPAGRWITPPHLPLRYDARLFLVRLASHDAPEVWAGELAAGALVPVARALRRWAAGELLLHPPNLHALRVLARPGEPSLAALSAPPHCDAFVSRRIEFQEGFFLAALRTPTIPPATHTNAWLVPAGDGLAVVDPGASDPAEQAALLATLDALAAEGRPPRAVWLTHVHPDHTGAVARVAERYGVPVLGHRLAAGRVPGGVEVRPVRDGELLGGRFRVLETPGHAREHLAFLDEDTGALVCGDMVSTLSTIVIDPPEGDMAEYERQLERLRALGPRTLYPAHGPPAPAAPERLGAYLAHRHAREALIAAALDEAPRSLSAVTALAYADTPPAALPLAERSCLAALQKLASEGRVTQTGEGWRRA